LDEDEEDEDKEKSKDKKKKKKIKEKYTEVSVLSLLVAPLCFSLSEKIFFIKKFSQKKTSGREFLLKF